MQEYFMFTFKRPAVTWMPGTVPECIVQCPRIESGEVDFISSQKMFIHTISQFYYARSAKSNYYDLFNFVQDHLALCAHLSHPRK